MHFARKPEDAKKLKKMIGDNPISENIGNEEEEHEKYELFEAIDVLTSSARELYCDGELKWEEMIDNLCKSIEKLKSKEKTLKKLVPEEKEEAINL